MRSPSGNEDGTVVSLLRDRSTFARFKDTLHTEALAMAAMDMDSVYMLFHLPGTGTVHEAIQEGAW